MEASAYDYFTPALTDCWDYVLERIREPEDVNSLILSCPLFAERLHGRKMIELFLPVLLRKTALPLDTLLSLRLLNKGTKHAVDTFLSDIVFDDEEEDDDDDCHWLQKASYLPPNRPDRLERFRTVYAPQILTGSLISSRLRIGAPRDRLLEPMMTFLQPIGHLIKTLQVELYCSEDDYPVYFQLFRLLRQLPVISSLSLQFEVWSSINQQVSFPSLPFLTELKLKSMSLYAFPIQDDRKRLIELLIQSYGSQLKLLSCHFHANLDLDYNLSNSDLSKLEYLEMGDFSRYSQQSLLYDMPQIQLSSLKTLVLTGHHFSILISFLDALEHIWSTLEELHIGGEIGIKNLKMRVAKDSSLWVRALPKLRRVVATIDWDSVFWLLFRVVFSNLEEMKFEKKGFSLDLDVDDDDDDFNGPCPQRLRGMLGKFFLLFPKLKQVLYVGLVEKCGSGAREQFVIRRPNVKEQPSAEGGGDGEVKDDDKTFPDGNKALESEGNGFQLELVLPIILKMKLIPFEDVLNCRLVCGNWKAGVDSVLQNHHSRLNVPEESRAFPLRATRKPGAQLLSTERLFGGFGMQIWGSFFNFGSGSPNFICWETEEGYIQRILAHPTNPFVGRSLRLRTNSLNHWFLGKSLLERFGDELWFLCYRMDESTNVNWFPVEQRIREALLLVPNLKWLELDVAFPFPMKPDEIVPLLEIETRVARYFRNHPLPRLLNLETLSCDRFFRTSPMFLSPILASRCVPETLKRLDVSNSKLKYKPSLIFPNLEELGIKMELKNLGSLKKSSPRLKKMSLILTNRAEDGTHQGIDADQVFGLLESFEDTLEDLGIKRELHEVNYPFTFKPELKIFLPKLEVLELDCDIPVESLENLRALTQLLLDSFSDDEQVEYYKLNIGRLVPSLMTFEFSGAYSKIKMRRDVTSGSLVVDSIEKYPGLGHLDEEETGRTDLWNRAWIWVMLSFLIILGGSFLGYNYGTEVVIEQLGGWFHEAFEGIFEG